MSLFNAIRKNDMVLFRELVNFNNVNETDDMEDTLLHKAISYNRTKMVKILLDHGANVNAINQLGITPIMYLNNNIEILKLMLLFGANVNIQNYCGFTIFHDRNFFDFSYEMIELILDHHADLSLKTRGGQTVFDIAKRLQKENISDFIHYYENRKELWTLWELDT